MSDFRYQFAVREQISKHPEYYAEKARKNAEKDSFYEEDDDDLYEDVNDYDD